MSVFSFVSHEKFPEDQYTVEIVYLLLEGKYRIAYVRKKMKTGGLFWDVMSLGITKYGKKQYFKAFLQDSNFLSDDIKDFLEKRKWEKGQQQQSIQYPIHQQTQQQPQYTAPMPEYPDGQLPF